MSFVQGIRLTILDLYRAQSDRFSLTRRGSCPLLAPVEGKFAIGQNQSRGPGPPTGFLDG
eukprot:scaffold776_cov347-Pavlova_lutheri.AAC.140